MKLSQKFCNILVHACLQYVFHVTEEVQAMEGIHFVVSIVVVGVPKCTLLHSMCDLKPVQMNV